MVYGEGPEIVLTSSLGNLDWDKQLYPPGSVIGDDLPGKTKHPFIDRTENVQKGKSFTGSKSFSLESDPYLVDHTIGETPYVPGVMGIETFFESANLLKGAKINSLKNVHFTLPIKLLRNKPIEVKVKAQDDKIAIESDFIGPNGVKLKTRTHFNCELCGAGNLKWDIEKPDFKIFKNFQIGKKTIYSKFFHGPSFQVLDGICKVEEKNVFAVYKKPSAPLWKDNPNAKLLAHPLVIESVFQACGYRDLHLFNRMSLPDRIGEITVTEKNLPDTLYIWAVFKRKEDNKTIYDGYAFDEKGKLVVVLKDYYMIGQ